MHKLISAVLLFCILSGCAVTGKEAYTKIANAQEQNLYKSAIDAAGSQNNPAPLTVKTYVFNEKDAKFIDGGVIYNFKNFSLNTKNATQLTIDTRSYIDKLNPSGTVVDPVIVVIDSKGKLIEVKKTLSQTMKPDFTNPLSLKTSWTADLDKNQAYSILIYPDNKNLDKEIGQVKSTNFIAVNGSAYAEPTTLKLYSGPVGKIDITVTLSN